MEPPTRVLWTQDEDRRLSALVARHGVRGAWCSIAEHMRSGRTDKQCRERWRHHLDARPGAKQGPLTDAEWRAIYTLRRRFGNQWKRIAPHLPGRTAAKIKNAWHTRVHMLQVLLERAATCELQRQRQHAGMNALCDAIVHLEQQQQQQRTPKQEVEEESLDAMTLDA